MNTEEAIFILKDHFDKRNWCEKHRADEALQMAIEALEKQIPKKPIIETISMNTDKPPLIVGFCPNCINNSPMVTNKYDICCRKCGQVLDWEKVTIIFSSKSKSGFDNEYEIETDSMICEVNNNEID